VDGRQPQSLGLDLVIEYFFVYLVHGAGRVPWAPRPPELPIDAVRQLLAWEKNGLTASGRPSRVRGLDGKVRDAG